MSAVLTSVSFFSFVVIVLVLLLFRKSKIVLGVKISLIKIELKLILFLCFSDLKFPLIYFLLFFTFVIHILHEHRKLNPKS